MIDRALLRIVSMAGVLLASTTATAVTPGLVELEHTYDKSFTGGAPGPATMTLPFSVMQGDFIYIATSLSQVDADILSISDTQGNGWQQIFALEEGFGTYRFGADWTIASATGGLAVTFQLTGHESLDVHVLVYSGVLVDNPFDHSARGGSDTDNLMSCDLETTTPGAMLVAFMPSAGGAVGPGPGATLRSDLNGHLLQDMRSGSPGPYVMTAQTNAAPWWAQCVALRPRPLTGTPDGGPGVDGGVTGTVDGGTTPDGGTGADGGVRDTAPLISDLGCSSTQNVLSLTALVLAIAALMRAGRRPDAR